MSFLRILVVDDNLWIRRLLVTILDREGYHPIEARDGVEAMDLVRAEKFDGIILDLMMPRADGFDVIRFLNAEKPELLPITIVLTADSSRWDDPELSLVGKVVRKPFQMEEIIPLFSSTFRAGAARSD
ncbi:MAG TPA: response regulator [Thermoanaerobaculia bacterium]|nr:response regulator [Thermoanaerobaculia bacterium]